MTPSGIRICLTKDSDVGATAEVLQYLQQNYAELKRNCFQTGLFTDPKFKLWPVSYDQLKGKNDKKEVVWKRPKEICQNPVFISQDGMNVSDVRQGSLGNCWFVAAAAALTLYPGILRKVVPKDQGFQGKDYAGIFHFQFWHFGQWVDVVVNDRLPTLDGKLLFVHSAQENEFWMPLLEKAYAKLNGSYAAIWGGFLTESFVDLTGGIVEKLNLKEAQPGLFKNIRMAYKRGSLMGGTILHKTEEQNKKLQAKGLIVNHVYTITDLHKILLKDKKVKLLQLRNPWGKMDWKGPWGYGSNMWSSIDEEFQKTLCEKKNDGVFWMQLEDFVDCFDILEICHFSADSAVEEFAPFRWSSSCFQGTWKKALAGSDEDGTPGEVQTNPQFLILFLEPDNLPRKKKLPKEGQQWEPTCTLLVSLMQKGSREMNEKGELSKNLSICYDIFQASKEYLQTKDPSQRKKLLPQLKKVGTFKETKRDVTKRFVLPPADYLIVPGSTSSKVDEFGFTLRIFTEKKHQHLEISDEIRADEEAFQAAKPSTGPSEVFENVFQTWAGKDQQIGTKEFKSFLEKNIISMGIPNNVTFSLDDCQKIIQHFSVSFKGARNCRLNIEEKGVHFKLLVLRSLEKGSPETQDPTLLAKENAL
ncbi:calpain-12-like [Varanus komodoensis]|uniref:calpain-12-like n=1 Tax=Varanus komodoensis TaxID=61221 RepID=UPI001CF7BC4C|nr:calpain-12-like [Varanus komodoensis]